MKNYPFLILAFLAVLTFSCETKEEVDLDNHTTLDNANTQGMFDDALKVTEDALKANGTNNKIAVPGNSISCASIDIQTISSTHIIYTITFDGSTCSDSKVREGEIVAELTGASSFNQVGAILSIKTHTYKVNGVKIRGKKVLTCTEGCPKPVHSVIVTDTSGSGYALITYPNGAEASWKSIRKRTLVSGGCDANISNNVYDINYLTSNPVAEGINRQGNSYTVDISSPVRVDFNCYSNATARYPTQGIIVLKPDGKKERSIDYGSGACDNVATIRVGKYSGTVNLSY